MRDYLIDILIPCPTGLKTRRFFVPAGSAMNAKRYALLQAEGQGLQPRGVAHAFVREANGDYRQLF